jgi:hypothetical protein
MKCCEFQDLNLEEQLDFGLRFFDFDVILRFSVCSNNICLNDICSNDICLNDICYNYFVQLHLFL